MSMQADKDLSSLTRLLQYAVNEAERLGINEIAWAKGISEGSIVLGWSDDSEPGNRGGYIEIKRDSTDYSEHTSKPLLRLVPPAPS